MPLWWQDFTCQLTERCYKWRKQIHSTVFIDAHKVLAAHPDDDVIVPHVLAGVEEGSNEEAPVLVLVNDNGIAYPLGVMNKPQVTEHINNHIHKHTGDNANDEYTARNVTDANAKEHPTGVWGNVHIAHLIVVYTPHTPTYIDDQINEHTVLNASDNINAFVTADNASNNRTAFDDAVENGDVHIAYLIVVYTLHTPTYIDDSNQWTHCFECQW